jgi:uncharacterized membrane protein YtjA (UPF0391 family)
MANNRRSRTTLSWALIFLVIVLVSAALGSGGIAGTAASIAEILFFVFLVAFVVSLVMVRRRVPGAGRVIGSKDFSPLVELTGRLVQFGGAEKFTP